MQPSKPSRRSRDINPIRERALVLAIQSYGPVVATGVEENILNRAQKFACWLEGEQDNQSHD